MHTFFTPNVVSDSTGTDDDSVRSCTGPPSLNPPIFLFRRKPPNFKIPLIRYTVHERTLRITNAHAQYGTLCTATLTCTTRPREAAISSESRRTETDEAQVLYRVDTRSSSRTVGNSGTLVDSCTINNMQNFQ